MVGHTINGCSTVPGSQLAAGKQLKQWVPPLSWAFNSSVSSTSLWQLHLFDAQCLSCEETTWHLSVCQISSLVLVLEWILTYHWFGWVATGWEGIPGEQPLVRWPSSYTVQGKVLGAGSLPGTHLRRTKLDFL